MNTRKWIILCLFVLVLIVALSSAYFVSRQKFLDNTAASETSLQAAATPAPAATEEPLPPLVAFAAPGADAAFRAAIASLPGIELIDTEAALLKDLVGLKAAVVAVNTAAAAEAVAAAEEKGIAVVAYNPMGLPLPDAVIEVRYAASVPATAEAAMETAIAYPPHDTPVRLFGVFESADGEAAAAWKAAVEAGRVLDKGTYGLASSGSNLEGWFRERLREFYPGMIDAVFVETPAQAVQLAQLMLAAQRDDFEIFTIGTDAALMQLMAENPRLLPSNVQIDEAAAAEACAKALSQVLTGAAAQDIVLGE